MAEPAEPVMCVDMAEPAEPVMCVDMAEPAEPGQDAREAKDEGRG